MTFPNISADVFNRVLAQLQSEGSTVTRAESGSYLITGHHWLIGTIQSQVTYDGSTVSVEILKPNGHHNQIQAKIRDAIIAAGGVA